MISRINSANVGTTYANSSSQGKEVSQKAGASISKQGDTSKVDQIKEALESGEYKMNLQALSKKIAEELM
jgi:flagellar biosynthesis anti-sigma factor FlgM